MWFLGFLTIYFAKPDSLFSYSFFKIIRVKTELTPCFVWAELLRRRRNMYLLKRGRMAVVWGIGNASNVRCEERCENLYRVGNIPII